MTTTSIATIDPHTVDRLSNAFHRSFATFVADEGVFADDTFFDLLPPMWRFLFEGPGAGDKTARRIHLCEVADGRISAVTTYCNGAWDSDVQVRHAAEAPMVRP